MPSRTKPPKGYMGRTNVEWRTGSGTVLRLGEWQIDRPRSQCRPGEDPKAFSKWWSKNGYLFLPRKSGRRPNWREPQRTPDEGFPQVEMELQKLAFASVDRHIDLMLDDMVGSGVIADFQREDAKVYIQNTISRALPQFDESRAQLQTFLWNHISNRWGDFLDYLKAEKRAGERVPIETTVAPDWTGEDKKNTVGEDELPARRDAVESFRSFFFRLDLELLEMLVNQYPVDDLEPTVFSMLMQEYSCAEIAEHFQVPVSTAKRRWIRVIRAKARRAGFEPPSGGNGG